MSSSGRLLLLATLGLALAGPSPALDHHDAQEGWTVTLPEGWVETPQEEIVALATEIGRRAGQPPQAYYAGFHRDGKGAFEYPYALVQVHRVRRGSLEDLRKELAGPGTRESFERTEKALSDIMSGSTLGTPAIDQRRKMVIMSVQSDVAGVGPVQGVIGIAPGTDLAVQINFYCTVADKAQDLPVCERMLDGFHFDAGKGYSPGGGFDPGAGGAIGGVIGIAIFLARKAKK
jgi:hypothetical protein